METLVLKLILQLTFERIFTRLRSFSVCIKDKRPTVYALHPQLFTYQRSLYSLLISRSVSRFLIVSLLSNFFLPFAKAISNLIFLFLLYTEIGTIVKLLFFSLSANSFISFFVSKSFLLRSGS